MKYRYIFYFLVLPVTAWSQAAGGRYTIGDKAVWILSTMLAYVIYTYVQKTNAHLTETKGLIKAVENTLDIPQKQALRSDNRSKAQDLTCQHHGLKRREWLTKRLVRRWLSLRSGRSKLAGGYTKNEWGNGLK